MLTYLPPGNSPFYANTDFKGIELFEYETTLSEGYLTDCNLIIIVDFNSCVGEKVVNCNTNANLFNHQSLNRGLRGTTVLILMLRTSYRSLSILNGVVGKDSIILVIASELSNKAFNIT